jgi:hypothetical protein
MAPQRGDCESGGGVRDASMTRASFGGLSAACAAVVMGLLVALPAGAAPNAKVGDVTVSNKTPVRGGEIYVSSDGWLPGHVATIAIASHDLMRVTADAHGHVDAHVVVPDDAARGLDLLTVTGSAASGVPLQIVTYLTVVVDHPAPAPDRPWGVVFVLIAAAALLLLASRRVERRVPRAAAS